jgi:hypothetical protein
MAFQTIRKLLGIRDIKVKKDNTKRKEKHNEQKESN